MLFCFTNFFYSGLQPLVIIRCDFILAIPTICIRSISILISHRLKVNFHETVSANLGYIVYEWSLSNTTKTILRLFSVVSSRLMAHFRQSVVFLLTLVKVKWFFISKISLSQLTISECWFIILVSSDAVRLQSSDAK